MINSQVKYQTFSEKLKKLYVILAMLNKLRCQAHF